MAAMEKGTSVYATTAIGLLDAHVPSQLVSSRCQPGSILVTSNKS
jgi:hypothetical protein